MMERSNWYVNKLKIIHNKARNFSRKQLPKPLKIS